MQEIQIEYDSVKQRLSSHIGFMIYSIISNVIILAFFITQIKYFDFKIFIITTTIFLITNIPIIKCINKLDKKFFFQNRSISFNKAKFSLFPIPHFKVNYIEIELNNLKQLTVIKNRIEIVTKNKVYFKYGFSINEIQQIEELKDYISNN